MSASGERRSQTYLLFLWSLGLAFTSCRLAIAAPAQIIAYDPDEFTLHLWHLDEHQPPFKDQIRSGLDLQGLLNNAESGVPSMPGLGTGISLNHDAGGQRGTFQFKGAVLLAAPALADGPADNAPASFRFAGSDGAFTIEALVHFDVIPSEAGSVAMDIVLNGSKSIGALTVNNSGRTTISGGTSAAPDTFDILTSPGNVSVGVAAANKSTLALLAGLTALNLSVGGATTGGGAVYQSGSTGTSGYGYSGMSGGTLTSWQLSIGARANGANGVMEVSGASTSVTSNTKINFARGNGSSTNLGLLNVTGGSVIFANTAASTLEMDYQVRDPAVLNVGGGVDPAAVTQDTGSAATAAVGLAMATVNATGTNALNLRTNGTLTVSTAFGATANATALINFDGATLKATLTNAGANFLNSANINAVTVFSNGGTTTVGGAVTVGAGALTLGSSLTFNGAGSLALSPIGGATVTTAPLTVTGGFIKVSIAGDSPKWTGALDSTWSTATQTAPKNWKLVTAGTATDYLQGDIILFDDTATTTTPDSSTANVSPSAVTFDNSTKAYTLGSSNGFGIAGTRNLTTSGTNTLTVLTSNTFTGPTTISAGTLQIGDGSTAWVATPARSTPST